MMTSFALPSLDTIPIMIFCTDAFYGGDVYSYDSSCTGSGICCTIVRNPAVFSRKHNRMLYAWVVFLPVSDRYDAADMIDIELL